MRKFLFTFFCFCLAGLLKAQSVVTISAIQAPPTNACNDTSTYYGDTVIVRAKVVMDGGLAQAAGGRNIWLQAGNGGANSGLDVFGFSGTPTTPDDVLDLVAGDSVEITGYIDEFSGESEIRPLNVTLLGSGQAITSTVVNVSDLNDPSQNNVISTGEQWEGSFIEVQNVTVTNVSYFPTAGCAWGSAGCRVSFIVQDGSGNVMNISDRFLAQRSTAYGGNFNPPTVGDVYCSIKGVLLHSKNNCPGSNGRGYELHPFDSTHYDICSAAPAIFNTSRAHVSPICNQNETITTEITDADGVASAYLHYAFGASTTAYDSVAMVLSAGNWTASIPGQADGVFCKYYLSATDNAGNYAKVPAVPSSDPKFFTFRCNGLSIYDVQYVPTTFNSASSGYNAMEVTVTGVVTASAEPGNLGYVFIQEENRLDWAGIMCLGSTSLSTLTVGQKVTVTGTVNESFGYTRLENVSSVSLAGTGTITPLNLQPSVFTTYGFATNEAYEGMLIRLYNPSGDVFVVDANADDPSNFAEYRVGADQFDPSTGCRVIAGRQTSSAFSSLNFSWVNDSSWATTDGIMNVDPCVVTEGVTFDSLIGIMYYSFSNFKIMPRNNDDAVNPSICATAIEGAVAQIEAKVYPNPTAEAVNVEYNPAAVQQGAMVNVFDLTGRKLSTVELNKAAGRTRVNLSGMPAGTYLLVITNAEGAPVFRSKVNVVR